GSAPGSVRFFLSLEALLRDQVPPTPSVLSEVRRLVVEAEGFATHIGEELDRALEAQLPLGSPVAVEPNELSPLFDPFFAYFDSTAIRDLTIEDARGEDPEVTLFVGATIDAAIYAHISKVDYFALPNPQSLAIESPDWNDRTMLVLLNKAV